MANHGPRDGPMWSAELRVAPEKRFATSCAAETRAGVCVSLSFAGPWGTRSARPMDGRLCQLDVLAAWDTRTWERTPPGAETGHAPPLPRASGSRARLPRDPPLREVSCRGSPRRAVKRAVPVDCTGSGVAVSSRADGLTSCSSPAQRTGVRAGNTLGTQHPPASPLPRQVTPLRPGDPTGP